MLKNSLEIMQFGHSNIETAVKYQNFSQQHSNLCWIYAELLGGLIEGPWEVSDDESSWKKGKFLKDSSETAGKSPGWWGQGSLKGFMILKIDKNH